MKPAARTPSACEQALVAWLQRCHSRCDSVSCEIPVETATLAVAYSGGADSTALLLASHAVRPGRVVALHVHHGLQAAADGFLQHARDTCSRLGIPLQVRRIHAAASTGQSPEEAARNLRYATLTELAQHAGASCVLLGQHADDQAETLMLALSRGAGLPGLAGMPEHFTRHGMAFGRPFLALPAQLLRNELAEQGEAYVDDPTNTDTRFTRNRIRALLLPAWRACFPGFLPQLARSARHAAQAQVLLDELARIDLQHTGQPPSLAGLQALSPERQANAVRHWLRAAAGVAASTAQLDELLRQVGACTTSGHRIHLKVARGFVTRDGHCLAYIPAVTGRYN